VHAVCHNSPRPPRAVTQPGREQLIMEMVKVERARVSLLLTPFLPDKVFIGMHPVVDENAVTHRKCIECDGRLFWFNDNAIRTVEVIAEEVLS
jgi:hypothetical protein